MRSRLILFHEMLLTHMKNTFSSSKEGIHDYLEQHTKVSMIAFIVPCHGMDCVCSHFRLCC